MKNTTKWLAATFALGLTYRLLISLQGVDKVDAGFCNTFYQVIFTHPDSNVFCFIYYLTGLVGGTWELLFGEDGLLGFRLLEALTLAAAIGTIAATFNAYMPRRHTPVAVALSFLFPTIVVTFHYDTITYLLVALSAYALKEALETDKDRWLMVAGAMLGMAFFARIVNAALFALALAPFIIYRQQRLKKTGMMAAGVLLGMAAVTGLMALLGHTPYYVAALGEAFSTFSGSEATHSHGHLLVQYLRNYVNIALQAIVLVACYAAGLWASRQQNRGYRLAALTALVIVVLVVTFTSLPNLTLLAACLTVLLAVIPRSRQQYPTATALSLYLTTATLLIPLGSDIGIQGIFNWCAGLIIFPAAWCASRCTAPYQQWARKVLVGCVACCALLRTGYEAYGEDVPRWACTSQAQEHRLNVYMEEEKALNYQRFIEAVEQHIGPSRLLFITNQAAELYYATRTLPYEGHVQPVIYTGERLTWRLDERLAHFGQHPLIAFLNQRHLSGETTAVQEGTLQWMQRHDYRLVYDDGFARLYATRR